MTTWDFALSPAPGAAGPAAVWGTWDGAFQDALRAARWLGGRWRVRKVAPGQWRSEPCGGQS